MLIRQKLTNVRFVRRQSQPAASHNFSLEEALEYIKADEYVEVTPHFMRIKIVLDENERKRQNVK